MRAQGTVCITGASSGIGESFARQYAARGYSLLLHGRRKEKLEALCEELKSRHGIEAEFVLAELSRPDGVLALEQKLRSIPNLEVLVNNAGYGLSTSFTNGSIEAQEEMVHTHVNATIRLTHAVLPGMRRRNSGTIINVSSIAGFLVGPKSATYCATKGYITSFTESLYLELAGSGVRLQALCPGYTRSDFHARMGMDTSGEFFRHFMSADDVVKASLKAIEKGTVVCIPGFRYKLIALAARFIPRKLYYWLANRTQGTRLRRVE
ncbi:MAG: short-chain dehydrogenase/reductase [Bacteroidetes bacterium]|nr:short-chain dehydrogenase/reductase [Bacteroidota bacterium]